MAISYLEVIEQLTKEEKITQLPNHVRITVTNRDNARTVLRDVEKLANFTGYIKRHHIHKHDEISEPCVIEDLTKTNEELDIGLGK